MQFLLTAYDGKDSEALERRMAVREKHLEKVKILKERGELLFGGAILNDEGNMIGSAVVYEFPDRNALDKMLLDEPYCTNDVWKEINIQPFRGIGFGGRASFYFISVGNNH